MNKKIFFLLNLLQDFYIIRKLIYLYNDDTKYNLELLITKGFLKRDKDLNLSKEIDLLIKDLNIRTYTIDSKIELFNKFNNVNKGVLIAASESTLEAHNETSSIMKICRSNITSITLQHGFECVGFLQNQNHSIHHGSYIGFNADIVCGWLDKNYQRDLINSSKSKYCALGHPAFINKTSKRNLNINPKKKNHIERTGLFCENIHSARFLQSNKSIDQFLNDFLSLAKLLDQEGKKIAIRPHPAGRFKKTITQKPLDLPNNVLIENSPSHKVDWSSYSYGISAPSSVILDMYLSGIPVCLWSDSMQSVDISLFKSFPIATSVDELFSFCLYHDNLPENMNNEQINSMLEIINKGNIGENYLTLIDSIFVN